MKNIILLLATIALFGCDITHENRIKSFSLFETSKGTVYLLNTASGEAKIIYSPTSAPKLIMKGIYESDDGKTYEYQGARKLKELTLREAADIIIEKYKK